MNIIATPNSNHFAGRYDLKAKWLIIHGTAGGTSAQAIANYFKDTEGTAKPVSSHYVIGTDGAIVQCIFEQDAAYANGAFSAGHDSWWDEKINPNLTTISIEHCKPSADNSDELTPAQKASSFQLIQSICARNGIPMRTADKDGGITGHYSIDPINRRDCPGSYPWNELWAYLAKGEHMNTIPTGWHDDGKVLTAPNGRRVVDGFRAYILANNWDAANEPAENECHVSQLETHNPGLGGGQRQIFTYDMLYWTPATNVKRSSTGLELQACHTLIGVLQSHIAQQQIQLQKAQDTAPLVAPAQPTVNVDDLVATVQKLVSVSDDIKAAGQRVLADIGK